MKLTQAQRNARDKHLEALRDTRDAVEAARDEYVADVENALEALEAARAEGSADEAEDARRCDNAARTFNEARRAAWDARLAAPLAKFNDAIEAASTFITETAEALREKYDTKCERSERWQMSDAGAAAETFVCEWETAAFDGFEAERPADIDADTDPQDIPTDPFDADLPEPAEELEALPEESET